MSIWQDSNGGLHDDMNGEALLLPIWPKGMIQLSTDQAAAAQQAVANGYTWNGSTYVAPPPPSIIDQAKSALYNGISVSLSGTMTLSSTVFPTDSITINSLNSVISIINSTNAFPGNVTTYPIKDSTGNWHSFNISQYKTVAIAIINYVANLNLIASGNPLNVTVLPASGITLEV